MNRINETSNKYYIDIEKGVVSKERDIYTKDGEFLRKQEAKPLKPQTLPTGELYTILDEDGTTYKLPLAVLVAEEYCPVKDDETDIYLIHKDYCFDNCSESNLQWVNARDFVAHWFYNEVWDVEIEAEDILLGEYLFASEKLCGRKNSHPYYQQHSNIKEVIKLLKMMSRESRDNLYQKYKDKGEI